MMAVVWITDILLVVCTVGGVEGLSAVLASIRIGRELWRPGQRVTGRLRSKGTTDNRKKLTLDLQTPTKFLL